MGLIEPQNSEPPLTPPPCFAPTATTTPTRNVLRSGEANRRAAGGMAGHAATDNQRELPMCAHCSTHRQCRYEQREKALVLSARHNF